MDSETKRALLYVRKIVGESIPESNLLKWIKSAGTEIILTATPTDIRSVIRWV